MLSNLSSRLHYAVAAGYGLLGLVLFFAAEWSAENFAWKVSPFVAMTIGGWCLGMAAYAWVAGNVKSWPLVFSLCAQLWLFALLQAAVLGMFHGVLRWQAPLTIPYVGLIALGVVAAVVGCADWLRRGQEPAPAVDGREPLWVVVLHVVFTLAVLYLGVRGMLARPGGLATEGRIFPEKLTLLSVRSFAALYLSISLASAVLLVRRRLAPFMLHNLCGQALIVPITFAAIWYGGQFRITEHPLQFLYLGAYVAVFVVTAPLLLPYRSHWLPPFLPSFAQRRTT